MTMNYNNPFFNLNVNKPFQIQEDGADKQSIAFILKNDKNKSGGLDLEELIDAGGLLGQDTNMIPQAKERLQRLYPSIAGSDELSAMELTQARLVMDNTIQGGDGQITAEEQQAFEQNLENNLLQGNPKLGASINYSNLYEFGKGAGVHDKLAPSAVEKQDAFTYAVVANEDRLNTSQIMTEHDDILVKLMEALGTLNNGVGNGLSNFSMGGGAALGADPNMQVATLYQQLSGMLEQTAAIKAQKQGKLGGLLPISPSQNT